MFCKWQCKPEQPDQIAAEFRIRLFKEETLWVNISLPGFSAYLRLF